MHDGALDLISQKHTRGGSIGRRQWATGFPELPKEQ